ncbi:hypothetical protein HRbin15_02373 [bacterium HR15]|nr:hypothetical protein HRbin15_02373 [bacterium HR15]
MLLLKKEQVVAFDEMMRKSFEERMVNHLRKHFAGQTAHMPEEQLRQRIRQEIATAQQHGITNECEVAAYISIVFSLSPNKPGNQLPWVRDILETAEPPAVKVNRLLHHAEVHTTLQKEGLTE